MASSMQTAEADNSVRLSASCEIVYEYEFAMCNEKHIQKQSLPYQYAYMTKEELSNQVVGKITQFEADSVVISRRINDYCPKHYILKLVGSSLSVLSTTDNKEGQERYKQLGRPEAPLESSVRKRLQQGIVFSSYNDALEFVNKLYS